MCTTYCTTLWQDNSSGRDQQIIQYDEHSRGGIKGQCPMGAYIHLVFPYPFSDECQRRLGQYNWEFFKQQWTDYEVATGLDKHNQKIQLATQVWSICRMSIKQPPTANADAQDSQQAMESTRRPVHSLVKGLHSPSGLLLWLCWSQPTQGHQLDSHNQVHESAVQLSQYPWCPCLWQRIPVHQ